MSHLREFVARHPKRPHRVLRRRVVVGFAFIADRPAADDLVAAAEPGDGPGRIVDVGLAIFGLFVVTAYAGAFSSFFLHVAAERVD